MSDIFEEVEEGLRQDKLSTAWRKYGALAYIGAGLLIGGVALNEYLTYQRGETIERRAGQLESALSELTDGDYEAAAASLTTLTEAGDAVSPIAAHFLAQTRIEGFGDLAAGAAELEAAAGTAERPAEKLALIKAAYLRADGASLDELKGMLAPLIGENSAYGALALEIVAAKALAEGDIEYARSEFNLIEVMSDVPEGVRQRAARALASMPPVSAPDGLILDGIVEEAEAAAGEATNEDQSDDE